MTLISKFQRSKYRFCGRSAFTLVEILIAISILAIFLYYVYHLFIGGAKTANKANWLSSIVDQLRNATNFLNQHIKQTSYPTTLLADTIKDPSDNPDKNIAQKYYLKILKNGEEIKAPNSGEIVVMSFVVCQPEKPETNKPGLLTQYNLYFTAKHNSLVNLGDLTMTTETFTFTTTPPQYARSGNINLTPVSGSKKQYKLCEDVDYIYFKVDPAATLPTDPTDFRFMQIKIHCVFPKDPKTFKDNSIMVTPNVGIALLP